MGLNKKIHWMNASWLMISVLIVALDQISKYWVMQNLQLFESKPVTSFFNITFTLNQGAAFSFLYAAKGINLIFIAFTIFMLIGMGWALLTMPSQKKIMGLAWSLLIGGALGNLIDRLHWGAVVDFLNFYWHDYHYAIFNLADSAICVGAVILMIYLGRSE